MRRRRGRAGTSLLLGTLALVAVAGPGMTSHASLYAEQALAGVQITGATVGAPLGPLALASVDGPVATSLEGATFPVTGSWGAPASAPVPDGYRVYRKLDTSVDWGTEPIAQPNTTSFHDSTAAPCVRYDYRVVSAYKSLRSPSETAIEASIVNDHLAPHVAGTLVEAAPDGVDPLTGFLRPGSRFYVYAHISDDCALADATLTADLSALGGPADAALLTAPGDGRWERDGRKYNFRAGPFVAAASLHDGSAPAWFVDANDGRGNAVRAIGAAATVDGTGPSGTAEAVSTDTNWYAGAHGSIRSLAGFRIHASLADTSGLSATAPVLDARTLALGAQSVPLEAGVHAIGPVSDFTHRSPSLVSRLALAHGATPSFSIVVRDRLGNTSTVVGTAHVDNVAPRLTSCSMTSSDALWGPGDTTTLTFSEPILPASAVPGWDGTAAVGIGATVRDGRFLLPDRIEYTGTTMFGVLGGHGLGSKAWTSRDGVELGSTTLSRDTATIWRFTYGGSSHAVDVPVDATPSIRFGTMLRDAAGSWFEPTTVACGLSAATPVEPAAEPVVEPTADPAVEPPAELSESVEPAAEPAAELPQDPPPAS